MGKYICLCGVRFKNKEHAEAHVNFNINLQNSYPPAYRFLTQEQELFRTHGIVIQTKWDMFYNWLFSFNIKLFLRQTGAAFIYLAISNHFNVEWTIWEAMLIGSGIWLLMQ